MGLKIERMLVCDVCGEELCYLTGTASEARKKLQPIGRLVFHKRKDYCLNCWAMTPTGRQQALELVVSE